LSTCSTILAPIAVARTRTSTIFAGSFLSRQADNLAALAALDDAGLIND
jgi:hypothetical protein